MKLSVQTGNILDRFGIDAGFGMISDAGFDCVDFNIDHTLKGGDIRSGKQDGFYSLSDDEISAQFKVYADSAKAHGVGFGQAHAPFPSYLEDNEDMNAYMIKVFEKDLEMLSEISCPWLVVHPAYAPYQSRMPREKEMEINLKMYSALIPAIKRTGVRVCTENMFSSFRGRVIESCMSDIPFACGFLDAVNELAGFDAFGFCYDVGHGALCRKNQFYTVKGLGKYLTCLHVHDNDTMNDEHLFPYDGAVDWDAFCDGLRDICYKGTLSFETFNGIDTRERLLAPELLKLLSAIGRRFIEKIEG